MGNSRKGAILLLAAMLLASLSPLLMTAVSNELVEDESAPTNSRSTTTWSGVRTQESDYTIAAGDTLVIAAGTTVQLGYGSRIYVEGELDIQGTSASPITLTTAPGTVSHEGIQFNATSRGRGSTIQYLVIDESEWGITIYDSNPLLEDVTINNADYVGVDLFNSANPTIRRLTVQDGGQDIQGGTPSTWRYGIGLSIGAGSAPFIQGATFDNLILRAVNMWGNSGGMVSGVNITNVSGATLEWPAAIWVEDSIALFQDVNIDRSDNGIIVRHITENGTTRPTFRDVVIENSQYRGIFIEQNNHSNWNAPLNAIFEGLTVRGTGGIGAKTPGLGMFAIGLNTSGADFEDVLIEDNICNGFKAYMIDSATRIENMTITGSGDPSSVSMNDHAGMFIRSSNWAPYIEDLTVSDSAGDGIMLWKASLQGANWLSENNAGAGLYIREAHPQVVGVVTTGNGENGLYVYDSSNVEFADLASSDNGASALLPKNGIGLYFEKSNDLMSASKNVTCIRCSSTNDAWGGVYALKSVDMQFFDLVVTDPGNGARAVEVDNSNMQFNGWVTFDGLTVQANRSGPIVQFTNTDAHLSGLLLNGVHEGVAWDGSGDPLTSTLTDSALSGTDCIEFTDLHRVIANNVSFAGCSGQVNFRDSEVNITDGSGGSAITFDMTGMPSHIRWIDSDVPPTLNAGVGSIFDRMFTLNVWAVNQHSHGLPNAQVNLSFDQYEADVSATLPYSGNQLFGPFIGTRSTTTGTSSITQSWVGCDYDGEHADAGPFNVDSAQTVLCTITLTNQPPLIIWESPLDADVYSSGGEILFNATATWDLDDDPISFTWQSNIDGNFCSGTALFSANDGGSCTLSDGIHAITLFACDDQNNCANETRTIELRNLPPSVTISTDPAPGMDGVIRVFRTVPLFINATGTFDPENDLIECPTFASYRGDEQGSSQGSPSSGVRAECRIEWNESFSDAADSVTQFDLTIYFGDGVNPAVEIIYAIELVNEVPHPEFTVYRTDNTSAGMLSLDGTASHDPEGDEIRAVWVSNLIGDLPDDGDGNDLIWTGWLPAGEHLITLRLSDDRPEHSTSWSSETQLVSVQNSPPLASISSHSTSFSTDSSILHTFLAEQSGDWDIPCSWYDDNWVENHLCSMQYLPNPDSVAVRWDSSLIEGALGTDWTLTVRLPAGSQTLTFTVDDGVNPPVVASVEVEAVTSAPILILASPIPGVDVYSDAPVLFDFRESFDADGDNFTVTVESNLLTEPIVDNGTTDYWYNDNLASGTHSLTFTLVDDTGMTRVHNQSLQVLPTGPHAVIDGLLEGQYIPPGDVLVFNGTSSYDADDDIIAWIWKEHDTPDVAGVEIASDNEFTAWVKPGPATFTLTVRDSRGVSDTAWINLTIGASFPVLSDLDSDLDELEYDVINTMQITVNLADADGTTLRDGSVLGVLKVGGEEHSFTLHDDGAGGDAMAGDGIWSAVLTAKIGDAQWASLEVWAVDGDTTSDVMRQQIPVRTPAELSGFLERLGSVGLYGLLATTLVLGIIGFLVQLRSRRRLADDLAMIESWGGGLGEGSGGFDLIDESAPLEEPDLDAPTQPALSDFGDSDENQDS